MDDYFLVYPQFEGVLWIFVFVERRPGPQETAIPQTSPHFPWVSTLVENGFKNPHGFWRVNPPTISHHPPKLLLDSLDLPAGHWQEWWSMWLGRDGSHLLKLRVKPELPFVFRFGRFPLVPELGDNYPKSGSFFLKYLDFELDLFCFQLDGFESFED